MSFTNYLEHAVLDQVFGGTSYSPSGTLYVGLSTTTYVESAGTGFTEPGSGYNRASITNNKSNWTTASQSSTSGSVNNLNTVSFSQATGGNWGTVTYFGIFDALTNGNLLVANPLTVSKTISQNDTASFASGSLVIRID